jgi:hypothetical protein
MQKVNLYLALMVKRLTNALVPDLNLLQSGQSQGISHVQFAATAEPDKRLELVGFVVRTAAEVCDADDRVVEAISAGRFQCYAHPGGKEQCLPEHKAWRRRLPVRLSR